MVLYLMGVCTRMLIGIGYISLYFTGHECMIILPYGITKNLFSILREVMPKYAVAKGRKIGVYDTWAECQAQTKGFTGAIFRKFNTQTEADDFIKTKSSSKSPAKTTPNATVSAATLEMNASDNAFPVPRISPSNPVLQDFNSRLSVMESKLSNLIDHVTNAFADIKNRLNALEGKATVTQQLFDLETENAEIEAKSKRRARKRKADDNTSDIGDDKICENGDDKNEPECNDPVQKDTKLPKCKIIDDVDGNFGIRRSAVNGNGFLVNPFGAVVVYTDGACANNGRCNAKAGIGVWFNHNHPLNVAAPVRGRATNNNAEIQAATAAVLQASKAGVRNLHIFTDSQFLISCITSWIHKWKTNNWQTVEGKPVINKVELIELEETINQHMDSVVWRNSRLIMDDGLGIQKYSQI